MGLMLVLWYDIISLMVIVVVAIGGHFEAGDTHDHSHREGWEQVIEIRDTTRG